MIEMKFVKGHPNYGVCSDGAIFNIKTGRELTHEITKGGKGYHRVTLCSYGKTKRYFVHRLVAELFIQADPIRHYVNHKDGNHGNNDVSNLEWVTHRENVDHAVCTGLCPKGEDNGWSKNTGQDIKEVCILLSDGHSCSQVVKKTGVSIHVVKHVRNRTSWIHVSKDYMW